MPVCRKLRFSAHLRLLVQRISELPSGSSTLNAVLLLFVEHRWGAWLQWIQSIRMGPRTMMLGFRSCGFIVGFYLLLRRWDFLPPETVSAGPPPLTHASTSGNLHFHRRPTRWAGSPLFSIHR